MFNHTADADATRLSTVASRRVEQCELGISREPEA